MFNNPRSLLIAIIGVGIIFISIQIYEQMTGKKVPLSIEDYRKQNGDQTPTN